MGYYFPDVPGGSTPRTLQMVLVMGFAVVVAGFTVRALVGWRQSGSPLGLALLIGGLGASLNEGFVDAAGLCWYPRGGQIVGYETIHSVPLWCVLAYAAYFGGGTYWLYDRARAGVSKRMLWTMLAALCVSEIAFEALVINLGGYTYYGNQPLSVGGMPVHWLALNFPGMFAGVALLVRMPHLFGGPRVLFAALVPGVSYAVGAFGAGWPIFSALHLRGASSLLVNLACFASIGLGLVMLAVIIDLIAKDGRLGHPNLVNGTLAPTVSRI